MLCLHALMSPNRAGNVVAVELKSGIKAILLRQGAIHDHVAGGFVQLCMSQDVGIKIIKDTPHGPNVRVYAMTDIGVGSRSGEACSPSA